MLFGTAKAGIRTSVLVSEEFYNLCKVNHIQFSEAMRVGISIILAERGVLEYDNKLNIYRKMNLFRQELEKSSQRLVELEKKEERTP